MSTIVDYNSLVSALQNATEDDGTEVLDYIPTAIQLAEERMTKEIDTFGLLINVNVSGSSMNRLITKPTDYRFAYNVIYRTSANSEEVPLRKRTQEFCRDYWPFANVSGATPKYYADYSPTQFLIAPTPDADCIFTLSYGAKPASLSSNVSTNYFIDWFPDALFYCSMIELCRFQRNLESSGAYEQAYVNTMQGANNQGRRERRDSNIDPKNPEQAVNSFKPEGN